MITKAWITETIESIIDSQNYGEICFFVFQLLVSPLVIVFDIFTLPFQIIGGIIYLIKERG